MKTVLKSMLVLVAAATATPAHADQFLVLGTGVLFQQTIAGPPRLEGVPFGGQGASFAFLLDDSVGAVPLAPPGNRGEAVRYPGALIDFAILTGVGNITRTPDSLGAFFVLNNAGAGPAPNFPLNLDQTSIAEGFVFENGVLKPHLTTDAALPADAFISTFNFGRVATTPTPGEPGLVFSTDFPDLEALWNGQVGYFFSLDVRQGNPTTPAELAALPLARFGIAGLNVVTIRFADEVPAPAGLALFGLGAAALLRRRAR